MRTMTVSPNRICPGRTWKLFRDKVATEQAPKEKVAVAVSPVPEPAEIKLYSFVYSESNITLIRVGFIRDGVLYCLTGMTPGSVERVSAVDNLYMLKEHNLPEIYQDATMNFIFPVQKLI